MFRFKKAKPKTRRQIDGFVMPVQKKPKVARYTPPIQKKSSIFKRGQKNTKSVVNREHKNSNGKFKALFHSIFDFRFNHDTILFIVFILLLLVGVVSIFSGTIIAAYRLTGNKFFFLFNHLKYIGIGFIAMSLFYFFRPEFIIRLWFFPLFISIALLSWMLIQTLTGTADAYNGAARWLAVGGFQFQPSDFAKLSFVLFVAAFLSGKKIHYKDFKEYFWQNLFPFSCWFFLILLLILVGNTNLGTAMVIGFIGIACYGVSAVTKYHRTGFLILLGLMVLGGLVFGLKERYRMDRIAVWLNYWQTNNSTMADKDCPNRKGCSDQFDQGLIVLGSGGLTGLGLGQSIGKYNFYHTTAGDDSVINIMGEELGFVFTAGVIFLYFYLVYRCISLAKLFSDRPIYFFLMIGTSSWIGIQAFIHIGANIGILPLTGQTLPFISLGGSSLISLMCAMGLILNVSKQKDYKFNNEQKTFIPTRNIQRSAKNFTL